jgi:FixJ family two-component response regulator
MSGTARTVFLVDPSPECRTALSGILAAVGYQVRSFESAEGFLAAEEMETSGCLLLEVSLPGMSGLELQHWLLDSSCARPVVFLSEGADIQSSVKAMKAGAVNFLEKPIDNERLCAAIRQALQRDTEQRRDREFRRSIQERVYSMTPRERQVMQYVTRGRLNKQIAAELGICEKTTKLHRARMMQKMGVRTVAELVKLDARAEVAIQQRQTCSEWFDRLTAYEARAGSEQGAVC